jgi:hypothetical protein
MRVFLHSMKIANNLKIAINSTAYYLLSYLFVFILHQLATLLAAGLFNFPVELDYSRILFLVSRYDWYFDSVKIIYSAGPLVALITAIFMAVVAYRYKEYTGSLKLFFLWGLVHCISIFLGSAYAGALLSEGFGHVLIWMFMGDTGKLIITLLALFLLAATGMGISRIFLLSANTYYNQLKTENRLSFVLSQVILPFIAGSVIIIAFRFPLNAYELLRILTPIIILLTVLLNSFSYSVLYFDENPKQIKLYPKLILATVLIFVVYRTVLHFPVIF